MPTLLAAVLGGWRGLALGAAQLSRLLDGGGPLRPLWHNQQEGP
jgi:hypothetical protein